MDKDRIDSKIPGIIKGQRIWVVATSAADAVSALVQYQDRQDVSVLLCSDSYSIKHLDNDYIACRKNCNNFRREYFLSSPPIHMFTDAFMGIKEKYELGCISSGLTMNLLVLIQPNCRESVFASEIREKRIQSIVFEVIGMQKVYSLLPGNTIVKPVFVVGSIEMEPFLLKELSDRLCDDKIDIMPIPWFKVNQSKFDDDLTGDCSVLDKYSIPLSVQHFSSAFITKVLQIPSVNFVPILLLFYSEDEAVRSGEFELEDILRASKDCLDRTNRLLKEKTIFSSSGDVSGYFRLRKVKKNDAPCLLNLVKELATYEKEPDSVHVTADVYIRDGFGKQPKFHAFLLDHISHDDGSILATCGYALWYIGYSTWEGKILYLEDLYIQNHFRGFGGGKAVMYTLADIADSYDCARFVWQALDWNESARYFYRSIGADELLNWITIRMDRTKLSFFLKTREDSLNKQKP